MVWYEALQSSQEAAHQETLKPCTPLSADGETMTQMHLSSAQAATLHVNLQLRSSGLPAVSTVLQMVK